jgi:glyoxylase-like metal-dependent hydrolase (beta-lactamase superfamily II)/8-oxo-dGTP pyrophosphatase MutT (NUDIX family)
MADSYREAATLVLVRDDGAIYWVKRARAASFGSYHVFPGGAVDPGDGSPAVAAIRETLEEVGVLLVPGAPTPTLPRFAGEGVAPSSFRARLAREGLTLDPALLLPAGRFLTPPFSPHRFDTFFFLARAPRGQEPAVTDGPELERGEWISPRDALAEWRQDRVILAAPTRLALEALAATDGDPASPAFLSRAAARLAAASPAPGDWARHIELRPGIFVFPVRTPTLPPATHTNVVLVGEGDELVAIDPASPYPEERAALDALIDALAAGGRRLTRILLTHRHVDHVSGADHLSRRTGAPILAHREVKDALRGSVNVTGTIEDGEIIDLPAPAPRRSRRLRAVLTPGHARGHLAFFEETSRTVVAGDMVAGFGFIIIDPPEGDMAVYLASLARLRALGSTLLYPAHGPPLGDPAGKIDEYVAHRLAREAKVLAAYEGGARTLDALVRASYADTPPALHGLAARSALAHVLKLEAEGKVPAGTFTA